MAYGRTDQIEHGWDLRKPHSDDRKRMPYRTLNKINKRRRERRRANEDPECQPEYRKYEGW